MRFIGAVSTLLLVAALTGCGLIPTPTPFVMPTARPDIYSGLYAKETAAPQFTALAATASADEGSLRQWASDAKSAFAESDSRFAAKHAIGAPDYYPQCSGGDKGPSGFGWVSPGGTQLNDTLTLFYDTPVTPAAVRVIETANVVGALVRIDVVDTAGNPIVVYEGDPVEEHVCGQMFSVGITSVTQKVDRVVLHFDRMLAPVWTVRYVEIDAVELVGNP